MATEKSKELKKLGNELEFSQVTRTTSILTRNQVQKIWNSTPKKYQYQRPAKGSAGNWTFVKGSYVRKVLDSVFGFDWDFDIETSVGEAFEVAKQTGTITLKGIITGRVTLENGTIKSIRKVQFGRAEIKWKKGFSPSDNVETPRPLDFGNDMKAAATDAFKKCASLFGIAQDIYEADEFMSITLTDDDTREEKEKAAKRIVEKIKEQDTISEESEELKDE